MASGLFTLKNQLVALIQNAWSGTSPSNAPKYLEYLVVAGGGAGGNSVNTGGGSGGGGAGGLLQGLLPIVLGQSYTVTVGSGGTGSTANASGGNGSNSVFGNITAIGGGGGATNYGTSAGVAGTGGSGGGGSVLYNGYPINVGSSGTSGQGNAGGNAATSSTGTQSGGGGGGAGTIGLSGSTTYGGNGGAGIASSISGAVTTYAGGGGCSGRTSVGPGTGGAGGGGAGGLETGTGTAGSSNSGGGGGGSCDSGHAGANGGSGIVIVRYRGNVRFFSGGTLSYDSVNNYTVHTFYASGTLAPLATPVTYGTTSSLTKSLRFRSSNSAYLSRTPSSATNRKTWTWSAWVKRGTLKNYQTVFSAGEYTTNLAFIQINSNDTLRVAFFTSTSYDAYLFIPNYLSDTSAWYHVVVSVDTTQATDSNRIKIYINGVLASALTSAYPSQNYLTAVNNNVEHDIGSGFISGALTYYVDGELAEINFIDGQALTPQSFGQYDATSGVWQPMAFVGVYGTNGFYLPFTNTTSTTTLGYDSSGNGNNFATSGFSLTAGSTYDSMNDVPTLTSATASNYAVVNPADTSTNIVVTNGNLSVSKASAVAGICKGSICVSSGKWYAEFTCTSLINYVGIASATTSRDTTYMGQGGSNSYGYYYTGTATNNGTAIVGYGATYTTGDVIGVAMNLDTGTLTYYKNGTSQGVAFSSLSGSFTFAWGDNSPSMSGNWNFGQQPFAYTAPSGHVGLNTYNLPTPTIVRGNQYMDATIYPGTGTSISVMNSGSFQPDAVWVKSRSAVTNHVLCDSVRGAGRYLGPNNTEAEYYDPTSFVTAFNSNGFTVSSTGGVNSSGQNFVAWQWKAGGTAVSNTSGSITSQVSANTTSGFSIVTYTGTGANATIGHGLGVAPKMIIVKRRNAVDIWPVYHESIGNTQYLRLQGTNAAATFNEWQNTSPTSSVFYISTDTTVNTNTGTYVAYCFAQIAGFSAFGSYTGNGSTSGPFVYTGFQPKLIVIKQTSSSGTSWVMFDSARNPYNSSSELALWADLTDAEAAYNTFNIYSNGFQVNFTSATGNSSGATYIYMAFATNPFRNSNAF
jgi:hypothetical protein